MTATRRGGEGRLGAGVPLNALRQFVSNQDISRCIHLSYRNRTRKPACKRSAPQWDTLHALAWRGERR